MATKNTSHNDNSKISWKDTNLALIGSELDHKMKQAAGARESAWVEGTIGQSPGLYIWRIEQFQVKVWPKEKYSQFHKGDSYIVLKSYREGNSEALHHDIHIWIGQESSQDEYGTAAYKMVEADDYLGGTPIQHRQIQGHEDDTFKSYFEVMEYLEGGIESGFRHVEPDMEHPVLFRVTGGRNRGVKTTMTLTQILPLSKSSLNEGDSFILTCGKAKVWCWHGKYAKPLEKNYSNQWAEKMCTMGTVTTLDQDQGDDEYTEFWNIIGNDGDIGPDEDRDDKKATSESFQPLLYRVDGNLQKELQLVATSSTEILMGHPKAKASACFKKSDLLEDDVFLIDTGWEIYVWIGSAADRYEKIASMSAADKYAKMDARTAELPVHIVKSGHESDTFLALFA